MKLRYPLLALSVSVAMMTGCKVPSFMPSLGTVSQAEVDTTTSRQLSMARLNERHGQEEVASKIYESVLESEPNNAEAMHRLGILAAQNQQYEVAIQHFQAALQVDGTNPELLSDMGYAHFLMDDLASAESYLTAALQADPQHESAHNNLGLVLGQQGRWNESLAHFRQAVDDGEAYANLAYIQTQVGEIALAEANFLRALDHDSELQPAAEGLVQLTEQKAIVERQMLARAQQQQQAAPPQVNPVVNPQRLAASQYTQPRRSAIPVQRSETIVGNPATTTTSPVRVVNATDADQSSPVVNATFQDAPRQTVPVTSQQTPASQPQAPQASVTATSSPVAQSQPAAAQPQSTVDSTPTESVTPTYPVTSHGMADLNIVNVPAGPRRPEAIDAIGQHDYYQGGPAVALPEPVHQVTLPIDVAEPKPQFLSSGAASAANLEAHANETSNQGETIDGAMNNSAVTTSEAVSSDSATPGETPTKIEPIVLPPAVEPANRQPTTTSTPDAETSTGASHSFSG